MTWHMTSLCHDIWHHDIRTIVFAGPTRRVVSCVMYVRKSLCHWLHITYEGMTDESMTYDAMTQEWQGWSPSSTYQKLLTLRWVTTVFFLPGQMSPRHMSTRTPVLPGHLSYPDTCLTRTPVFPGKMPWTHVTQTNGMQLKNNLRLSCTKLSQS